MRPDFTHWTFNCIISNVTLSIKTQLQLQTSHRLFKWKTFTPNPNSVLCIVQPYWISIVGLNQVIRYCCVKSSKILALSSRAQMWVPGRLLASEWKKDIHCPEHRAGPGNRQPAPQTTGHRSRRCRWRGPEHPGPEQVRNAFFFFFLILLN